MRKLINMRPLSFLKKFSRIKRVYIISLAVALCLTAVLIYLQQYLSISRIIVNNTDYTTLTGLSDHPITGLSHLTTENIILLDTDKLQKDIYANNPEMKKITISIQFPDTLLVDVEWYTPFVQLTVNTGYFVLSEDGRILRKMHNKDKSLPEIHYYQQLNYGSFQSGDTVYFKDIISSLHFLKLALDLGFKINMIDINGLNMIGLLAKDKKFIFTTEKDTAIQDYQFTTLIKQFKIEGTNFTVLDLRFDKPVIQITK